MGTGQIKKPVRGGHGVQPSIPFPWTCAHHQLSFSMRYGFFSTSQICSVMLHFIHNHGQTTVPDAQLKTHLHVTMAGFFPPSEMNIYIIRLPSIPWVGLTQSVEGVRERRMRSPKEEGILLAEHNPCVLPDFLAFGLQMAASTPARLWAGPEDFRRDHPHSHTWHNS